VDEIERVKEEEEQRALAEGELLNALVKRRDVSYTKRWYIKERLKRGRERRRRIMTGAGWKEVQDTTTGVMFWHNTDTGEASYTVPQTIQQQEAHRHAQLTGFAGLPSKPLLLVMAFLPPLGGRTAAAGACTAWATAARDPALHRNVFSVEMAARDQARALSLTRTVGKVLPGYVFATIQDAISAAHAGDIISLGAGHHWEGTLVIDKPLKIVGGSSDASRCVMELTGSLHVTASAGHVVLVNLTLRRPRKVPEATSCVYAQDSRVSLFNCIVNNDGGHGSAIFVTGATSALDAMHIVVSGGSASGVAACGSKVCMSDSVVSRNGGAGVLLLDSFCALERVTFLENKGACVSVRGENAAASLNACTATDCSCAVERPEDGFVACRLCSGDDSAAGFYEYNWVGLKHKLEPPVKKPKVELPGQVPVLNHQQVLQQQHHAKLFQQQQQQQHT